MRHFQIAVLVFTTLSVVIAGNARAVSPAILSDEATLHVHEGQLLFNPVVLGNSRILSTSFTGVEEELNFKVVPQDPVEEI